MRNEYPEWLEQQGYAENTQNAQLHRVSKVEEHYGELEKRIAQGTFDELIQELSYSVGDERASAPNPSKIPITGNLRTGLQSYKSAAQRYANFISQTEIKSSVNHRSENVPQSDVIIEEKQRFALERDMQSALRRDIFSLRSDLSIVDDGAERSVVSGFIDILCQDDTGKLVVVELKAGKTDTKVVAQILGYMGDLMSEDDTTEIEGIIVAHDFDKRTISAAKAVPNLQLVKYSISFSFEIQS